MQRYDEPIVVINGYDTKSGGGKLLYTGYNTLDICVYKTNVINHIMEVAQETYDWRLCYIVNNIPDKAILAAIKGDSDSITILGNFLSSQLTACGIYHSCYELIKYLNSLVNVSSK